MTQNDFQKLLKKQQEHKLNKAEEQLLESFISRLQVHNSNRNAYPGVYNKKRIRRKIDEAIGEVAHQKNRNKKRAFAYVSGIAALLCIGFFTFKSTPVHYNTVTTGKGQQLNVVLTDGSNVKLNANSSLTYPDNFKENRTIELSGEAFFEVYRDEQHPFTIKTGMVKTTVLGTSFNINSYDVSRPVVSVRSGKVRVQHLKTGKEVYLLKDEQVVFNGLEDPITSLDISEDPILWMNHTIVLKNTSLMKTASILENWYDVKIEFNDPAIKNLQITGKFHREPLQTVLQSIALINHLKIDTLSQNHFMIHKNAP